MNDFVVVDVSTKCALHPPPWEANTGFGQFTECVARRSNTVGVAKGGFMRKILVAVDGSESALRALDVAAAQARRVPDGQLHLLTVRHPASFYGALDIYVTEEQLREIATRQATAVLDAAAQQAARNGIPFEIEQLEGEPAAAIVDRAAQLGCESIVMGSHGRGQLGAFMLGSVAQRVVHGATVPVTLVK
jgi:nucleotide-binding universal stress UspA family protein